MRELERRGEGITVSQLANGQWELDTLKELGLYREDGDLSPDTKNLFVRYSPGLGVCDDAAMLTIGKIYGPEAMLFAYLIDATDTYGKNVLNPVNGGVDEQIGVDIQNYWEETTKHPLVSEDEITRVIYLAAKDNSPRINFSSSHRRFCQYEATKSGELSSRPTILNHMNYLFRNDNPDDYPINLGFDRFWAPNFYKYMEQRWSSYEREHEKLPVYSGDTSIVDVLSGENN